MVHAPCGPGAFPAHPPTVRALRAAAPAAPQEVSEGENRQSRPTASGSEKG